MESCPVRKVSLSPRCYLPVQKLLLAVNNKGLDATKIGGDPQYLLRDFLWHTFFYLLFGKLNLMCPESSV